MKLKYLVSVDSSIKLLSSASIDDMAIEGISNSDDPKANTIVFLKNKKYHNLLGKRSSEQKFPTCLLLIEQAYQESLSDESRHELEAAFPMFGTVSKVDNSMSLLSRPFYDEKFSHLNFQVDGRTLGRADVHPDAEVAQGVFIGEGVKVGRGTKILSGCSILPNVEIGENCLIFPNVTFYPYCRIGNDCRIHAGTVIGTDGFGYNFFNSAHQKVWHFSGVVIGNQVEIGCNTMIDAGAFTPTEIGNGSKIDNDVQISHNVKVREHVIICGKTGLAGSVEVKNYCSFGAGAGVAPSAIIEEGAQVAGRAVVSENAIVPAGSIYAGHPARPLKDWLKTQAATRKLVKR